MPAKKTELPEPDAVPMSGPMDVAPLAAAPLPSAGGCYVIEAGELKLVEPPADPVSATLKDPV